MRVRNKIDLLNSKEMSDEWLAKQRLRHEKPDLFGLKSTGLKTLDKKLGGGIEKGQLVYVGGQEKSGKTTLLTTMANAFGIQALNGVMLSAEMTNLQMGNLLFSNLGNVERTTIRSIQVNALQWDMLDKAGKKIEKLTFHWGYGFSSIEDIDAVLLAVEEKTEKPVEVLILDYLQLMEVENKRMPRTQEIEYISRSLKRRSIARGNPMMIIAATQLNRESIRSKLYDAQSFLGSGAIERDMDIGMIVTNVENPLSVNKIMDNKKKIVIVGSRETEVGEPLEVYYDGSKARMADIDEGKTIDIYKQYQSQKGAI